MQKITVIALLATVLLVAGCNQQKKKESSKVLIGTGQMPGIAMDQHNQLHLVYGSGDSIMYAASPNGGSSFTAPEIIDVLPGLAASAMRGPQIACSAGSIIVLACNKPGNIFSYCKTPSGKWLRTARVNDVDTVAKEQFMSLSADGSNVFAAWLDLRGNKRNKIVGAQSSDGGRTWSKNILVYASPDSTVCQCCKPSVAVQGETVYVMFRNWLNGNRDLYIIQSADKGKSFGTAKKLGNNNWLLDGCPMDGGGMAINSTGNPQTVWRRKDTVYACQPGQQEIALGEGRGCTIETVNDKNVYAWTEKGEVIVYKPGGIKINLGKGQLPLLKRISNEQALCVWEDNRQVQAEMVRL